MTQKLKMIKKVNTRQTSRNNPRSRTNRKINTRQTLRKIRRLKTIQREKNTKQTLKKSRKLRTKTPQKLKILNKKWRLKQLDLKIVRYLNVYIP